MPEQLLEALEDWAANYQVYLEASHLDSADLFYKYSEACENLAEAFVMYKLEQSE